MQRTRGTFVALMALAALTLGGCAATEDLKAAEPTGSTTEANQADDSQDGDAPEADDASADDVEDEPADDEVKDLVVKETAFGKDSGTDSWWYVVILDNPNERAVFDMAGVDIEAIDDEGTILDSTSEYATLLPGEVAFTGTFFGVADGKIDKLNVRGPDASSADEVDGEIGDFTVSKVKAKFDEWTTDVSGTVKSSFAEDKELVQVSIVARNSKGKIIGADMTFVDRLPAGGKAQFKTSFLDELPKSTKFKAYAQD